MLYKKEIICTNNLLKIAQNKGPDKEDKVNAGKKIDIDSNKQDDKAT